MGGCVMGRIPGRTATHGVAQPGMGYAGGVLQRWGERQCGDDAALDTRAHTHLPAVQVAQATDDRQADAAALRMAGMGAAVVAEHLANPNLCRI